MGHYTDGRVWDEHIGAWIFPDSNIDTLKAERDALAKRIKELEDANSKLKKIADELWGLLDNIDTLSDMIKPVEEMGYKHFYDCSMKETEKRHKFLHSDGYNLTLIQALNTTEVK